MMFEIRTAKVGGWGGGGQMRKAGMLAKEETVYLKSQAMVARIVLSPGRKDETFLCCWWGAWNPGKAPQESGHWRDG